MTPSFWGGGNQNEWMQIQCRFLFGISWKKIMHCMKFGNRVKKTVDMKNIPSFTVQEPYASNRWCRHFVQQQYQPKIDTRKTRVIPSILPNTCTSVSYDPLPDGEKNPLLLDDLLHLNLPSLRF